MNPRDKLEEATKKFQEVSAKLETSNVSTLKSFSGDLARTFKELQEAFARVFNLASVPGQLRSLVYDSSDKRELRAKVYNEQAETKLEYFNKRIESAAAAIQSIKFIKVVEATQTFISEFKENSSESPKAQVKMVAKLRDLFENAVDNIPPSILGFIGMEKKEIAETLERLDKIKEKLITKPELNSFSKVSVMMGGSAESIKAEKDKDKQEEQASKKTPQSITPMSPTPASVSSLDLNQKAAGPNPIEDKKADSDLENPITRPRSSGPNI